MDKNNHNNQPKKNDNSKDDSSLESKFDYLKNKAESSKEDVMDKVSEYKTKAEDEMKKGEDFIDDL